MEHPENEQTRSGTDPSLHAAFSAVTEQLRDEQPGGELSEKVHQLANSGDAFERLRPQLATAAAAAMALIDVRLDDLEVLVSEDRDELLIASLFLVNALSNNLSDLCGTPVNTALLRIIRTAQDPNADI